MGLRFSPFLLCGEVRNSRRECARFETGEVKFATSNMELSELTGFAGMFCPQARFSQSALGREFRARLLGAASDQTIRIEALPTEIIAAPAKKHCKLIALMFWSCLEVIGSVEDHLSIVGYN